MITTVVFDADDTLLDLRPAVTGALATVLDEMRRLAPAAAGLSVADLAFDFDDLLTGMPAAPVVEVRRAGLARSLTRVGLRDHLGPIAELYFARRFALTRPFAETLAALAELRRSYTLGFGTNGNSRTDRCGLAGEFAFEVYAHVDGVPKKPEHGFYAAVLEAAGVSSSEVVYVGDSLAHDVLGAQAAGLRAVWLNRAGASCPQSVRPDVEIRSLAELPGALDILASAVSSPLRPGDRS
jgi:HAD superfamily hydrolase (TIGR01509 family)